MVVIRIDPYIENIWNLINDKNMFNIKYCIYNEICLDMLVNLFYNIRIYIKYMSLNNIYGVQAIGPRSLRSRIITYINFINPNSR